MTCDRMEVEDAFKDCGELVKRVVGLLPEGPNDRDPAPEWRFLGGRAALLGDAAHPMAPHQSARGGQAIADAYIIPKASSRVW